MKIIIQDYREMRYDTIGDYVLVGGEWHFYVARLSKRRYEACVVLHEIIECYLCYFMGIKEENIYKFDIEFEKNRQEGNDDEPGDDKDAPYYYQHQIATFFEKIFAFIVGVNWKEYSNELNNLN